MTVIVSPAPYKPFLVNVLTENSESLLPPDHRLSITRWRLTDAAKTKAAKEGKKLLERSPVCVAIPVINVTVQPEILASALSQCLAELQDLIVSEAINKAIADDTAVVLTTIEIDPDSVTDVGIAAWQANKAMSGRLSSDTIGNWFDTALAEHLQIAIVSKYPDLDEKKLTAITADYRSKFTKLASPKASMPEGLVKQLQAALGLAESNDKVKAVLSSKLAGFLKPAEEVLDYAL